MASLDVMKTGSGNATQQTDRGNDPAGMQDRFSTDQQPNTAVLSLQQSEHLVCHRDWCSRHARTSAHKTKACPEVRDNYQEQVLCEMSHSSIANKCGISAKHWSNDADLSVVRESSLVWNIESYRREGVRGAQNASMHPGDDHRHGCELRDASFLHKWKETQKRVAH